MNTSTTVKKASSPQKATKSLFVDVPATTPATSANHKIEAGRIGTISVPKYDGTMSITKYLKLVDAFTIELKKERYNLLLAFVNDWLKLDDDDVKLTSLSDFKNMEESVILKDKKHNNAVLRKYRDQIVEKLNPNFDIDDETDSDDIKDKYIIYFMSKSLVSIDFSMVSRTYGKKVVYTIRMK